MYCHRARRCTLTDHQGNCCQCSLRWLPIMVAFDKPPQFADSKLTNLSRPTISTANGDALSTFLAASCTQTIPRTIMALNRATGQSITRSMAAQPTATPTLHHRERDRRRFPTSRISQSTYAPAGQHMEVSRSGHDGDYPGAVALSLFQWLQRLTI